MTVVLTNRFCMRVVGDHQVGPNRAKPELIRFAALGGLERGA